MMHTKALMERLIGFLLENPTVFVVAIIALLVVLVVALACWVRRSRSLRNRELIRRRLESNLEAPGIRIEELRTFRQRSSLS